jgi:hypothetical protein
LQGKFFGIFRFFFRRAGLLPQNIFYT